MKPYDIKNQMSQMPLITAIRKQAKMLTVGLLAAASMTAARADILTWDPLLGGGTGGTGTWNLNSTANWWNGSADVKWLDNSPVGTNLAVFAGSAGTVTLNTSLSASNLQFTTTGYTVSGSGTLTLNGGFDASSLTTGTTTIGNNLTLSQGQQLWQVGSGGTLAINGTVTRNAGATVDFSASGITSTSLANVNDILGGWATTGNAYTTTSGGDWVTSTAGSIGTYAGYTLVSGNQTGAGASAQNWKNSAAGTLVTLTASATINSLVQQGDVSVNNGVTLTLGSGGLILQGISRWMLDNGGGNLGTAVLNSGLASGELFIHTPNSTATDWRIWPRIQDNGATPTIVVKDGFGFVALQNTNSYSGGTIINNGVLASSRDGSVAVTPNTLGFGAVQINPMGILEVGFGTANANLDYYVTNTLNIAGGKVLADDGHQHLSGPINILAGGATFGSTYDGGANASTGNKALFIDGLVSGSGPIALQQSMAAGAADRYGNGNGNAYNSSVVEFGNNANTYSGTLTVVPYATGSGAGSYLCVNGSTALQYATLYLDNNAGGHRFAASGGLYSQLVFNTGLGSATLGAISGPGNIILNGYNENTYALQTDAIALTVGGNNASSTLSGIITGTGSLTKAGNGILTLSGANTYTGNTTISGGTLALTSGFISSTNITVAAGAALDVSVLGTVTLGANQVLYGGGTNNGSVSTTSGTRIYAGLDGTYGTNRFNNDLTLVSGASVYLDVGTLVNGTNDRVIVAGTLTANNNSIHLKAPSGSSLQTSDYVLISSANAISGSFNATPTWDVAPANAGNFSVVTSGTTVTLHYTSSSAPSGGGFATPATVTRNQKTLLTVITTNGVPGTVQSVTVDLSSIGGSSSVSLVRSNSSNVFTNTVAPAASTVVGGKTLPATVTDSVPLNGIVNIALTVISTNDVWNGAGSDNFFSSNLNWTNLTAPGLVGDSLEFAGTTRLAPSMDNSYTVTGVTFDSGAGSFNISTPNSSTLTLAGNVVNNSTSAQTLNVPVVMSAAQIVNTATGDVTISGAVSGSGTLTKLGNNTLTLSGASSALSGSLTVTGGTMNVTGSTSTLGTSLSRVGYLAGSGNLNISGGSLTTTAEMWVGGSDVNGTAYNATGNLTVSGGANVSLGKLTVARGNNNQNTVSGTVTVNSGSTLSSENDILLGFAGNNNLGKVVVNGGTFNIATATKRWVIMSQWDTAQSEIDVNSGQMNINANTDIRFSINGNSGTNTFNLNGGAVTFYSDNGTTVGGSGVVDLHQGNGSGCVNTFNLNGGTLTVAGVTSANNAGSRTFNFNGGTLKADVGTATFMSLGTGSAVAYVRNGGAIIDDGGFGINIDQPLLHSAISGDNAADGGLTKQGAGTVTLTGVSTYNGSTHINGGTLALSGSGSINNSTNITITGGAIFDVSGVSGYTLGGSQSLASSGNVNGTMNTTAGSKIYGGTDGTYGTNTFNNDLTLASGVIGYLDLGTVSSGTNDEIVVTGILTANNNVLHLKAPSTSVSLDTTADYVLVTSPNAISGTFATAPVWDVAPVNAGHYSVVTSNNVVLLRYSASVSAPTVAGSASPTTLLRNQSTKITANVTPGSGSITSVTVDLTSVGGTSATLVRSNLSNLYTNTVAIPAAAAAGNPTLTVTATDNNSLSGSASIPLTISTSSEVWNGGGANQSWSTNQNWISGSAPGLTGDSVVFAGSTGLAPSMDNSYSLTGLSFSNTAGAFTIGTANSSALTLTANGIVNNSASAQTLNVPVSLTSAQNISAANGDITISGVVTDNGNGLTKTGNHTLTLSGNNTLTGPALVAAGTLNLSGTIAPTAATVGNTAGNSVLNISGSASLTAANLFVGNVSNAVSAVYQTGGSVSLSGGTGDLLSIGNWSGSYGYYNAAGGTITLNGISIGGESNPNVWPPQGSGDGIMEVNGATISNNGWIVLARGGNPETGILNVYSGSLTFEGGGLAGNWQLSGTGQTAIINIMGGTVSSTTQGVDFRNADTGILNLNGGVLQPISVTGQGTVNFNGGTLKSVGASGSFVGVNTAYVHSGGAIFDNNGAAVTVSQALLAPAGNGVHGYSSFTGGAGYIAPPIIIITNGTGDTTGSGATAIAQINRTTGSVTNIIITCPGVNYTATPVFLVSGGGATTAATITGSAPTANTSGGLTSTGAGTLTLSGANTYTGNTTVSAGTLEIAQAVIAASSTVSIASGAKLQLDFSTTNSVSGLVLNGISQSPGVYNNNNASTYISGSGSLVVATPTASNPTNILFSVSGSTMSLSWPSDHLGWILQQQTNSLSTGISTNWVDVAGTATITSTNIAINPAARTAFYRLRHP